MSCSFVSTSVGFNEVVECADPHVAKSWNSDRGTVSPCSYHLRQIEIQTVVHFDLDSREHKLMCAFLLVVT